MVDVGAKPVTRRYARARGRILLASETLEIITSQGFAKGDVFGAARLAGIMAAKRTGELIPLCHPLPLSWAGVELIPLFSPGNRSQAAIVIVGEASLAGQTGIEMEALTAVTIAGLTVYDMCKAVDKAMSLAEVSLLEKKGGRSGHYFDRERSCLLHDPAICTLETDALVSLNFTLEQRLEFRLQDDNGALLGWIDSGYDFLPDPDGFGETVVVLGNSLLHSCPNPDENESSILFQVIKAGNLENDAIFAVL